MTEEDKLYFDPATHTYKVDNVYLAPVTTVVKYLKPAFDQQKVAQYCAMRDNKSVQQVLCEWERKALESTNKGTAVHAYIERFLTEGDDSCKPQFKEIEAFHRAWRELNGKLVRSEWKVYSKRLGIAGTIDLVVKLNGKTCIADFKTGKVTVSNPYQYLLPPLERYQASSINVYSIQTSLYRMILKDSYKLNISNAYIIHLKDDGDYNLLKAKDFNKELTDLFKNGLPTFIPTNSQLADTISVMNEIMSKLPDDLRRQVGDDIYGRFISNVLSILKMHRDRESSNDKTPIHNHK